MAEQPHHEDLKEKGETSLNPVAPPANPETMPEKIQATTEGTQELGKKQTNKSDIPEPEYPPMAKVIPAVAALYMAFFLVALVRPFPSLSPEP